MNLDDIRTRNYDFALTSTSILIQNHTLLLSIADLIINKTAENEDHKNELKAYLNERYSANFKVALESLVESPSE